MTVDWLMSSSPLLALAQVKAADALLMPRQAVQHAPADDKPARLGQQFEDCVARAVTATPHLALVARNLQIIVDGVTLGELDLLVRDHQRDCLMHWELTLKLYLGLSDSFWPGPNPNDHLQRRANHLLDHQLPLIRHPATRELLAAHGWQVDEQRVLSRGRLFYPAHPSLTAPTCIDRRHARGFWYSSEQIRTENSLWQPVPRHHWPAPEMMSDNAQDRLASPELIDYVESSNAPVMVLQRLTGGHAIPGFIVSRQWLTDAHAQHRHVEHHGKPD